MRIAIKDDKKGKRQSVEAELSSTGSAPDAHYSFDATGYGENEEEAIKNLEEMLKEMIAKAGEIHTK